MTFEQCNEITTDGLLNVFKFDLMASKKVLSKKKGHNTFIEMPIESNLVHRKWSCYLESLDSSGVKNNLVHF